MKKLNVWAVSLLMAIMVFSGLSLSQAAQQDCEKMTNLEFTAILVDILGFEMPAGAENLSDAELFEVQAAMLAERGITLFVDGKPDAQVTCSALANVLYDALMGPSIVTIQEKIDYLADLGHISAWRPDDVMCSSDVIDALNVPELSTAIAEAYSPPGVVGFGGVDIPGANPGPEGPIPLGAPPLPLGAS